MPNAHLRSLLTKARNEVEIDTIISYDTAVALMRAGCDVPSIERNFRKEQGFD